MCDVAIKEFNECVTSLFNIMTMKATTSAQKADISELRRKYAAYKSEITVETIIKDITPSLVKKRALIIGKNATEIMSQDTRNQLTAATKEQVIINMYDFCVITYKSCSQEETDEIWRIIGVLYVACIKCAAHWQLVL